MLLKFCWCTVRAWSFPTSRVFHNTFNFLKGKWVLQLVKAREGVLVALVDSPEKVPKELEDFMAEEEIRKGKAAAVQLRMAWLVQGDCPSLGRSKISVKGISVLLDGNGNEAAKLIIPLT